MKSEKILSAKNLCLFYGKKEILRNLSFEIFEGDYVCIFGENGSGKSTLLRTILGLHKDFRGKIEYGKNFSQKKIGYMPQQTIFQKDFPANVFEVVLSGTQNDFKIFPFYNLQQKKLAHEKIALLGMQNFENQSFSELSGGQRQRVFLARALCAAKNMIFLDEPFSALDFSAKNAMSKIILDLNQNLGMTILAIFHEKPQDLPKSVKILQTKREAFRE